MLDQSDPYDIGDRTFAQSCICGAEISVDQVFCPSCRSQHENLLSKALAHLPNQVVETNYEFNLFDAYRSAYGWAKADLEALTQAPVVRRVMEKAA